MKKILSWMLAGILFVIYKVALSPSTYGVNIFDCIVFIILLSLMSFLVNLFFPDDDEQDNKKQ